MKIAPLLLALFTVGASAQIRQIDATKLPQDPAVQDAYKDLLPVDEYARNYVQTWRYPIPKSKLASRFIKDLTVLLQAQQASPGNAELRLFTGLVAHLAYNLDVENAYPPALNLLTAAASAADEDFRPSWFLAVHQCESNNAVGGMQRLLKIESTHTNLPAAFWRDYALCAQVTSMPVHAQRAYDVISMAGSLTAEDSVIADALQRKLVQSEPTANYPSRDAWRAAQEEDLVVFTSSPCGESFIAKATSPVNIPDVQHGTCSAIVTPGRYPAHTGESSPSLLLLTRTAKPGETLEAFTRSLMTTPRYASAMPIASPECPVAACIAFEIVDPKMYSSEGGAHLIVVAFESKQPRYPGLKLESPASLPKPASDSNAPQIIRAARQMRRFEGTLYTFLALDANKNIYTPSKADFDAFVKSIVVD